MNSIPTSTKTKNLINWSQVNYIFTNWTKYYMLTLKNYHFMQIYFQKKVPFASLLLILYNPTKITYFVAQMFPLNYRYFFTTAQCNNFKFNFYHIIKFGLGFFLSVQCYKNVIEMQEGSRVEKFILTGWSGMD